MTPEPLAPEEQQAWLEAAPPAPPRDPVWGWADAALFFTFSIPCLLVAGYAGTIIAKMLRLPIDTPAIQVGAQSLAYLAMFVILAKILEAKYGAPFWRSLGWVRSSIPTSTAITMGVGLAFGIAILGALLKIPDVNSPLKKILESPGGAVTLALFGTTVGPVAEELAFRGFLQPLLVRTVGAAAGILISAGLFGLLHLGQNADSWLHVGLISLAGIAFGVLRHVSGSTRTSILAHAAYNSTLFFAFFAFGRNLKH